ncbi:hypothetical protein [Vibrio maritimus]|uniref:hypothetical protein n=1 Tax=Vibrio maritimus TaxID=990268 RepID=UPI003734E52A
MFMLDFSSSMSTMDKARLLELSNEHPEDVLFGKLLAELGNQSAERVRSSAMKMELDKLKHIVEVLSHQIDSIKVEKVNDLARKMKAEGFSKSEVEAFFNKNRS